MTDRDLNIKVAVNINGQPRVNKLHFHLNDDGSLTIAINNGGSDGVKRYGRIRLNSEEQKLLLEFVQRNIK